MKVLHVIPALAARYGGPSTAVLDMCRALRTRGVDILVATTDADGAGRLPVERGRVQMYEGVPVIFFARHGTEAFKYSRGLARWLEAHVADYDVVQVHAVFSHASVAAARACRRHGVPYVLRPLGTLDPWSLAHKQFRKRLFIRLFGRAMFRHAAAIDYTTAEEKRLAEDALGLRRGFVVPLGLPDAAFSVTSRREAPPADPYVLALCRLDPKKGLDLLVRAFLELRSDPRCAGWRLVIAGEGNPAFVARLQRLSGADRPGSSVTFTGWVSGVAKSRLLEGASLFALTSHQENFGISIVEAMARGVPVLLTPGVNLARDIEAAQAGWVAKTEVGAIRDALMNAICDPRERLRRGIIAREFADRFRWTTIVDDLIAEYRAAIDEAAPQPRPATASVA